MLQPAGSHLAENYFYSQVAGGPRRWDSALRTVASVSRNQAEVKVAMELARLLHLVPGAHLREQQEKL